MGIVIAVVLLIVVLTASAKHKTVDIISDARYREFHSTWKQWEASVIDRELEESIDEWMVKNRESLFNEIKSFMSGDESWDKLDEADFMLWPSDRMCSNWWLVKLALMAKRGKLPYEALPNGTRAEVYFGMKKGPYGKYVWKQNKAMSESLFLRISDELGKHGVYSEPILKLDTKCYPLKDYSERYGKGAFPDYYRFTWAALCMSIDAVD